jgi:hypothetical protein
VSEQETRKKLNALKKIDKTLQRPARNSEKHFEALQVTRRQNVSKSCKKAADSFATKFSGVSHKEAGNFPALQI